MKKSPKKSITLLVVMLLIAVCISSCNSPTNTADSSPTGSATVMSLDDYPVTQGSNPTRIISEKLFTHYTGLDDTIGDYYKICHTGTAAAYTEYLDNDSITMIIAQQTDPETEEKMKKMPFKPIAKDALVFITNIDNPIDSLSLSEIEDILSGRIENWKDVGGNDEPINLYERNEEGGSQILLDKYVLKGKEMKKVPRENIVRDMKDMSTFVAENTQNGSTLGYTTYYYAEYSGKRKENDIKTIKIDGTKAAFDSIQNETYPIIAQIYIGAKTLDSPAGEIYEWLTTPDGQKLIQETGYVPL